MTKKLSREESILYRKYHIPGTGNLNSVKLNAIFLHKANGKEHELAKFELAWETERFITEAERVATEEEQKAFGIKKKIVDFIDLTNQKEWEIVHNNEDDEAIRFYRKNGKGVYLVDGMECSNCKGKYPKRNQKGLCQRCSKEKKNGN